MKKAKFDPLAVTGTLINRVHRIGITLMILIEKSRNKSANISPRIIDDLKTDYLLANIELENMMKTQLAQKKDKCWSLFIDSVNKISRAEKPIFRGVLLNIKQTAENILTDKPHPFDLDNFELPHYVYPNVGNIQIDVDQTFWEIILKDAIKLEDAIRNIATSITDTATQVSSSVNGIIETPVTFPLASTSSYFTSETQIGDAVNNYMGW